MATTRYSGTSANEVIEIRNSSPFTTFNGRGGDDIYVISPKLTKNITITDNSGNNIINLPNGIKIAATEFYADEVTYTLSTGAKITIAAGNPNLKFVWGDLDLDADLSTPEGKTALTANAKEFTFKETAAQFGVNVDTLSDVAQKTEKPVEVKVVTSETTDPVTGVVTKTVSAAATEIADVDAPVYVSSAVSVDGKSVVLTYGETLSASSAPASAFAVTVDGNRIVPTNATVLDKTVTLTLDTPVTQGQPVTVSYVAPTDTTPASASDLAMQDLKGNNSVSLSGKTVTNGSTVTPDVTAPEFIAADAQVDATGTKIILPYNEALGAAKPASSAFKVTVDGKTASPASVTIDGKTVVLTVNKAIITGAAVSVEYTAPAVASTGKTNPAVQDLVGNDATGIAAATTVTNNSAVDGTPPKLLTTSVAEDGKSISFTFSELLAAKTAALGAFEVKVGDPATVVQATSVSLSEDTITLALPKTITKTEKVTVTYTAPDADALATNAAVQDLVGNDVASFVAATDSTTNPITGSAVEDAAVLKAGAELATGSDNDNVFSAVVSSASTLDSSDTIDGGLGDNLLNVTLNGNFAGFVATAGVAAGSMKAVQTVNLSSTVANAAGYEFNATGVKGVTKYGIDAATAAVTLKELASIAQVDLFNLKTGALTVGYSASETTSPALTANTTDTQKVTLTNVGETAAVKATIAGVETLTLTSSGTLNKIDLENVSSAKAINVNGTAPITVAKVPTTLTSFDSSAAKAAVTADLTNANALLGSIMGGEANDTITIDPLKVSSSAVVSGGTGTADTLVVKSTNTNNSNLSFSLTGVEVLNVDTLVADKKLTFGLGTGSDSSLTKLTIGTGLAADLSVTTAKNIDITATGAADAREVTIGNAGPATVTYSDSTTAVTNALKYKFYDATNLTVTVGKNVTASGVYTALNTSDFTLTATSGAFSDAAVSSSSATGKATISIGSTASSLAIAAQQLVTMEVSAGANLTLNNANAAATVTSNLSGLKTLTVTQSSGLFDASAVTTNPLKSIESITLSGANGSVKLGDLGSNASASSITLTANGALFGDTTVGLKTGTVTSNSGNITLSVADTKGKVEFGNVTSTSGNVTINAATKSVGTFTVGAITGKEVSLDVSGVTEAITLAAAAITATTKANFTGAKVQANAVTIAGGAESTDLLVTVTGGNENDTITVNGGAKQTALTVTGDGKLGTNTLAITASSADVATKIDAAGVSNYAVTITGKTGADTIIGSTGADTISGAAGNDSITGGLGNDAITVSAGTDTITDWSTGDTLTISGGVAKVVVPAAGGAVATFASITNSAQLWVDASAATGAITVTGSTGADSIVGGAGADSIVGGAGTDTINGGTGNDTITGGSGDDAITVSVGTDTITDWGTGTDTLTISASATAKIAVAAAGGSIASFAGITNAGTLYVDATAATAATTVTGSTGIDSITGGSGTDSINAGSGNDTIDGGADSDVINGEGGSDSITGGAGNDTIDGGADSDTIAAGAGTDSVTGGTGADTFTLQADSTGKLTITDFGNGADSISGAFTVAGQLDITISGSSTTILDLATPLGSAGATANVVGGAGSDTIKGGAGNDVINVSGSAGSDSVVGGAGNDVISSNGSDTVTGGAGSDTFNVSAGTDTITDFTAGTDTLSISANATAKVYASTSSTGGTVTYAAVTNAGTLYVDGSTTGSATVSGIQNITGSTAIDSIVGGSGADVILGGVGSDTINGGAGNDLISGGAATNAVDASAGSDSINGGEGNDTIYGSAQSDTIVGGAGPDSIIGGAGSDNIDAETGNDTIVVADRATMAGSTIVGGADTDTLVMGGASTGFVDADFTNDTLLEVLTFANGVNTATLGTKFHDSGIATINGGTGVDTITFATTAHVVTINGGGGVDVINLASIAGQNVTFNGTAGITDSIAGGSESDTITGGAGSDIITGGAGSDVINGSSGADTITGGAGIDSVTGGADADTFDVTAVAIAGMTNVTDATAATDVITDFVTTTDKIKTGVAGTASDATGYYAESLTPVANVATVIAAAETAFAATTTLKGSAYNVGYYFGVVTGGAGYLIIDADANSTSNGISVIQLTGVTDMAATDIIA